MIVVVGGTGFIGSALVRRLRDSGFRVRTFSRRAPVHGDGVDHVSGDLADMTALRQALRGAEHVFHLAWTTLPKTSNDDPTADVADNLVGGCKLLDACRQERIRSLVFLSSGGTVYGPGHPVPIVEHSTVGPICSYGITKLAFEYYLALYRRLHGLDYRILRVSNAYGEGQPVNRPQGFIGVALDCLFREVPITVWGDGSAVRDYIYVGDIASACIASLATISDSSPRIFNISSQEGYSIVDVLAMIETVTGIKAQVVYAGARSCDVDRVVLSNSLAKDVLGWFPTVGLKEGLLRTWTSFSRKSLPFSQPPGCVADIRGARSLEQI